MTLLQLLMTSRHAMTKAAYPPPADFVPPPGGRAPCIEGDRHVQFASLSDDGLIEVSNVVRGDHRRCRRASITSDADNDDRGQSSEAGVARRARASLGAVARPARAAGRGAARRGPC